MASLNNSDRPSHLSSSNDAASFSAESIFGGIFDGTAKSLCDLAEPAAEIARRWPFRSIGTRPKDWIQRDALFSCLVREKAMWPFQQLVKARAFSGNVLPGDVRHAIQLDRVQTLQFLYAAQHLNWSNHAESEGDDEGMASLSGLLSCPPVGILVSRPAGVSQIARQVCHQARQCPACFARLAGNVHARSLSVLEQIPRQRLFVQLGVEMSDRELPHGISQLCLRQRVRVLRRRVLSALRSLAGQLGVGGGVQTFIVGPSLPDCFTWDFDDTSYLMPRGFRYFFGLLGSVAEPTAFRPGLMNGSETLELGIQSLGEEHVYDVSLAVRALDEPSALRALLVGTSPNYIGEGGPIARGVLSHQPWLLGNYLQWRNHRIATKGMRIFEFFDNWKILSQPVAQNRLPSQPPLLRASANRSLLRFHRQSRLRSSVFAVIQQLQRQQGKRPGRQRLLRELQRRDIMVSGRDIRQFLADFGRQQRVSQ